MAAPFNLDRVLLSALKEDIGNGDITSSAVIPARHKSKAVIVAKEDFVLAGLVFAERVFKLVDNNLKFSALKKDGSRIKKGAQIAKISGNTSAILAAERTVLNLLQRISGIATVTDRFVRAVQDLNVEIADTRKTVPGLRYFDKYAVRAGGGTNHRFGLFDGILIKDNHISAAGGIGTAIKRARRGAHHLLKIEVEVKNLREVSQALKAGADTIMLDNMTPKAMTRAVARIRAKDPSVTVEASGNVNLDNLRSVAESGVDIISVGSLTHSANASDISLKFI